MLSLTDTQTTSVGFGANDHTECQTLNGLWLGHACIYVHENTSMSWHDQFNACRTGVALDLNRAVSFAHISAWLLQNYDNVSVWLPYGHNGTAVHAYIDSNTPLRRVSVGNAAYSQGQCAVMHVSSNAHHPNGPYDAVYDNCSVTHSHALCMMSSAFAQYSRTHATARLTSAHVDFAPVATMTTKSTYECGLECRRAGVHCVGFNVERGTGVCELLPFNAHTAMVDSGGEAVYAVNAVDVAWSAYARKY